MWCSRVPEEEGAYYSIMVCDRLREVPAVPQMRIYDTLSLIIITFAKMWTFRPIYKFPIWGAGRLPEFKGDRSNEMHCPSIGESWEISDVDGNVSVVALGPDKGLTLDDLMTHYGADLVGKENFRRFGNRFPLLIKLIDTSANLSVQVHPDDAMAQSMGHPFGKNEMWVVLDAEPGATLSNGFIRVIDPKELLTLVESGDIMNVLRNSPVQAGSAFFIPAGRVHAIGKGILTAEIQQTSDDTFRLYDYNRTDANGNKRQLHLDQAAKALNYADTGGAPLHYSTKPESTMPVSVSPYFTVNMMRYTKPSVRDYSALDSFVAIMCLNGKATLSDDTASLTLTQGNTVLLPATQQSLSLRPEGDEEFKALEIYI